MDEHITLTDFTRELEALATLRDELKLKASLARAELRSELDDLERRWRLADEQLTRTKLHMKQDGALLERKFTVLLNDLKLGFQNAKRAFESER